MSNVTENPTLVKLVQSLNFVSVRKQATVFTLFDGAVEEMPLLSYLVNSVPDLQISTILPSGAETSNVAQVGDVIISGVYGEQYVLLPRNFPKFYTKTGNNDDIIPEQSPREVAEVSASVLPEPITFVASWGEDMVLHPGDFLVKDKEGNVYRIERNSFLETYDWSNRVDPKCVTG